MVHTQNLGLCGYIAPVQVANILLVRSEWKLTPTNIAVWTLGSFGVYLCDADDCFNFRLFSYIAVDLLVADNALFKNRCWTTRWFTFALIGKSCCKSLFSKVLVRLQYIPLELRIILMFEFC